MLNSELKTTRIPEATVLTIVVPCYNEEELIKDSAYKLVNKLERLISKAYVSPESRIIFVDDGSTDKSWEYIKELHQEDRRMCGISLAHNRGHQFALLAGLTTAHPISDVTITIDADLQQDIEAMDSFLEEYYKGSDIVYGIRKDRETDTRFKKNTAKSFYALMRYFGVDIQENAADYRLLSNKALDALSEYKEANLFLRGITSNIGLNRSSVYFDVYPRIAGVSKYTTNKMMKLAIDGITSFTIMPIHFVTVSGIICFVVSIIMIIATIIDWAQGNTVPGYSTILVSIWLVGGLILLGLGIVGEYVGRTYMESKHRPRYYIKEECMDDRKETD